MNISFGGLGNGIDFGQIVDFLIQVERAPIDRLNQRKLQSQEKLTDYGTLGTKLLALQSASSSLKSRISFDKSQVEVSSASTNTLLSATSSSTATAGTHTITVNKLATAHQISSQSGTAVSSIDTDIVSGSSGTFTFTIGGGSNQTVNLDADATLDELKNAINDLGAGVSASTLNTGTESSPQYRLVLTSNDTGADNTISIVTDTTTLATTSGVDTFQAAQDSEIVLGDASQNPVTLNRSGNTITDVISGVNLNLQAADTGNPVTVTVSQDTGAVKESISSFVEAYNDIVTFIDERTFYNVETKERGILVGDTLSRTVLDRLRQAAFSQISGLETITGASQIGFETDTTNGTIKLNEADLDTALSENYSSVRELFIENPTNGTVGIAELVSDAIDALDDVETGPLAIRQNGLTEEIDDFSNQVDLMEEALARFEEQQRIKFANLDSLLSSLQSQLDLLQSRI